ncbi:MAG: hypothetical protein JKY32_04755 [Rhizobiales bacterium]|nr:hypothetical protein [Hyphomicrobiales bacterium]
MTNELKNFAPWILRVALAETGGGILILLGGLGKTTLFDVATRVGAVLNVPVILGAIWMIHWGRWNFVPTETHPMGGMEFQVTLLSIMLFFMLVGNGNHSRQFS